MALLAKAVQTLPLGTAYAIWTGIGAVGTVLIGIFVFKEPATPIRLFFLFTLIASLIGLKCIRHLDGHRGCRHGLDWNIRIQGACHSHPAFLPVHAHRVVDRVESRVILKGGTR